LIALHMTTKTRANRRPGCTVKPFAFKGFGAIATDLCDIADEFPHLLWCGIDVHSDFVAQFHGFSVGRICRRNPQSVESQMAGVRNEINQVMQLKRQPKQRKGHG